MAAMVTGSVPWSFAVAAREAEISDWVKGGRMQRLARCRGMKLSEYVNAPMRGTLSAGCATASERVHWDPSGLIQEDAGLLSKLPTACC